MTGRKFRFWIVAALGLFLIPVAAWAGSSSCGCSTTPTPPCCKAPPAPSPPTSPCCSSTVVVPSVNVYVAPSVVVNAAVNAVINTSLSASATATGTGTGTGSGSSTGTAVLVGGGGGGGWSESSGPVGEIQALNVVGVGGGGGVQKVAYEARRTKVRLVVIQAVCLDDKDVPHPASQVTPDREIPDSYEGEIYRCIAGTRMQWTLADYVGKVDFTQGQTFTCNKNDALVLTRPPGGGPGTVACLPQKPARDCNERSLLRRFGAGVKIIKIVTTETYTAYREEQTQSTTTTTAASAFNMTIDGGVGGVAH